MSFLNFYFFIFKITGVWKPFSYDNNIWKTSLYNLFTLMIISSYCSSILWLILGFKKSTGGIFIYADNFSLIINLLLVTIKIINLKLYRKKIIQVTKIISEKPYAPETLEEKNIIIKYESINR